MRVELEAAGYDVAFVAINKDDAAGDGSQLADRCRFPLLQDTSQVQAWSALGGSKDDLYVYDADGILRSHLPVSGNVNTNLSEADGYANVKAAILAAEK